jgi:hypothetical protein
VTLALPYCRRENYLQYISFNWLQMYEAILPGMLVTKYMDYFMFTFTCS